MMPGRATLDGGERYVPSDPDVLVWDDNRDVDQCKEAELEKSDKAETCKSCIYMYIFGMRNPFHCL